MVGEILLEDTDKFNELINKMVMYGAENFDYNTLTDIDECYG